MTTTQQQVLPSSALVARADSELAELHRRRSGALELITAAQGELSALQGACADRQRVYDEANAVLTQTHSETQRVQAWADLALTTPSEATALAQLKEKRAAEKSAEKATRNAQKQLEAAQADLAKREGALTKSITDNQALIADLDQRRLSLQAARDQIFEQLGRETLEHVATQLQVLRGQTDKQRSGLIECQLDLNAACEAARATLAPWPGLLAQAMAEYNVYQDATTRVLNAWLAFMDTLAVEGPAMYTSIVGYSPAAQMEISQGFIESVMRQDLNIEKKIADRRAGAQRLVQLYIENVK